MKIVVLAGGLSPERDVSLSSGTMIANALMKNNHQVVMIDLYKGLSNATTFEDAHANYHKTNYSYIVPETLPDLEAIKKAHTNTGHALIGENIIPICQTADITFMALHGSIGENGQVQALFDLYNIAYTGSDHVGSLLAMDKVISKKLMKFNGITTPNWLEFNKEQHEFAYILERVDYPCVVKPVSGGSSIGVSFAANQEELKVAIKEAHLFEDSIIIEQQIKGREFSVGILDNKALPVIEIIPNTGFYDYQNKYQEGATTEICPAQLNSSLTNIMQEDALKIHHLHELSGYSRVDFILDNNEKIHCLEVNTLPGMTPTSLLPQEAKEVGFNYEELCEKIIHISL